MQVPGKGIEMRFVSRARLPWQIQNQPLTVRLPMGSWTRELQHDLLGLSEVFDDPVAVAALINRLVHHAEMLVPRGDSYGLKGNGDSWEC